MTRVFLAASAACLLVLILTPLVFCDSATTLPVTLPYVFTLAPGMKPITVALHRGVCPPEYEQAVRKGLSKIIPATKPTTTAADLLERLAGARQTLLAEMTADLALPQEKVAKFLDSTLKPQLEIATSINPKVFVIVATQDQVTAAIKGGWSAPLFHYDPLAGQTLYEPRVQVTVDRQMDDVVLWDEVKAGESDDDISDSLAKIVEDFESSFPLNTGEFAMLQTRNLLIAFMSENVTGPMKLPPSETWFTLGLLGTLSSKYTSPVTGLPRASLSAAMSADSANNPIQSAPLDLYHPYDPNSIEPRYLSMYVDAMSRKSAAVMQKLLDEAGDAAVPKILAELKAHPPADNAALVKSIQSVTGIDLTDDLLPK
jgi:hypothetical protein